MTNAIKKIEYSKRKNDVYYIAIFDQKKRGIHNHAGIGAFQALDEIEEHIRNGRLIFVMKYPPVFTSWDFEKKFTGLKTWSNYRDTGLKILSEYQKIAADMAAADGGVTK